MKACSTHTINGHMYKISLKLFVEGTHMIFFLSLDLDLCPRHLTWKYYKTKQIQTQKHIWLPASWLRVTPAESGRICLCSHQCPQLTKGKSTSHEHSYCSEASDTVCSAVCVSGFFHQFGHALFSQGRLLRSPCLCLSFFFSWPPRQSEWEVISHKFMYLNA